MDDTNIKTLLGENYREGMTNDEIVEALSGISLPKDNSDELARMKKAFDNKASELAESKRQLKARMTEEETKKAEEAEKFQKMQEENDALKKRIAISDLTTKFISSGLDADTAVKTAEAAYNGDYDTVVANYNGLIANSVKSAKESAKAEMLQENPVMQGGRSEQVKDYSSEIEAHMKGGDLAYAAALTRMQQTQNINNN